MVSHAIEVVVQVNAAGRSKRVGLAVSAAFSSNLRRTGVVILMEYSLTWTVPSNATPVSGMPIRVLALH